MRAPLLMAALSLCCVAVSARAEDAVPEELKGISIEEKPGAKLPENLVFTDENGAKIKLGSYLHDDKPLVMVLAYYSCPMLCTLVLNGITDGLKDVAWNAGDKFRVLVVSIDPRDTVQVAHDKRANHLKSYGRRVEGNGWDFVTSDAETVKTLADAIGFHYRWDDKQNQFAHAAGAFIVTPEGVLSRTLFGITFSPKDLRLALLEASEGKMGSAWDKVLLFCFHYDPAARGYVMGAARFMRMGGALTVLLLAVFLTRLFRKERARTVTPAEHAS